MKTRAFLVAFATLFTANVQADIVGLYLGGQIWQSEASGFFGEKNTRLDFNLKKEQQSNFFIAIEHPLPLLPNARISSTTLDTTGKTTLTQEFSFGNETFPIGDDVNASFNVSYIDYTLYYELFDNDLFSFELGLSARDFKGDTTVTGSTIIGDDCTPTDNPNVCINYNATCNDPNPSPDSPCQEGGNSAISMGKIKINSIEPMLYVATNISLPLTGLSVFAQGDFSLANDDSLSDYQVGLSYDLVDSQMVDFNLTLGYRVVKMEFENLDSLYADLKFKGAFVGVIAHF